jgi:hypothetical protein
MNTLSQDWKANAPFAFVDVSSLGDESTLMFESFDRYTRALEDVILVKMPDLLYKAERVIEEAEDMQRYAEPQFERLDLISKGKAVFAMSFNMRMVSKIPGFIKAAAEDAKSDMD